MADKISVASVAKAETWIILVEEPKRVGISVRQAPQSYLAYYVPYGDRRPLVLLPVGEAPDRFTIGTASDKLRDEFEAYRKKWLQSHGEGTTMAVPSTSSLAALLESSTSSEKKEKEEEDTLTEATV